jgi:RNA polymerase sigma-70 factor, ECF subfamily
VIRMAHTPGEFSELLDRWRGGDRDAADRVLAQAYEELRRLARYYMRQERAGHTLQPTALVNEAYLRLANAKAPDAENRTAFLRIMGAQLRHLLIDHARRRNAVKRGGGQMRDPLEHEDRIAAPAPEQDNAAALLNRLDVVLPKLAAEYPRVAKVMQLRFFADMSIDDTATALGVSTGTVKRDYSFGRAWLLKELQGG